MQTCVIMFTRTIWLTCLFVAYTFSTRIKPYDDKCLQDETFCQNIFTDWWRDTNSDEVRCKQNNKTNNTLLTNNGAVCYVGTYEQGSGSSFRLVLGNMAATNYQNESGTFQVIGTNLGKETSLSFLPKQDIIYNYYPQWFIGKCITNCTDEMLYKKNLNCSWSGDDIYIQFKSKIPILIIDSCKVLTVPNGTSLSHYNSSLSHRKLRNIHYNYNHKLFLKIKDDFHEDLNIFLQVRYLPAMNCIIKSRKTKNPKPDFKTQCDLEKCTLKVASVEDVTNENTLILAYEGAIIFNSTIKNHSDTFMFPITALGPINNDTIVVKLIATNNYSNESKVYNMTLNVSEYYKKLWNEISETTTETEIAGTTMDVISKSKNMKNDKNTSNNTIVILVVTALVLVAVAVVSIVIFLRLKRKKRPVTTNPVIYEEIDNDNQDFIVDNDIYE